MVTQEEVLGKLRECLDPELGVNIVDLGLVYGVSIEPEKVRILMTLTTPGCPLDAYFHQSVTDKIKTLPGIKDVEVELTFDPPWDPQKMSEDAKLEVGWPVN